MAKSAKRPTLDFCSSQDLRVLRWNPMSGSTLSTGELNNFFFSLSPSPLALLLCLCVRALSLSKQIN